VTTKLQGIKREIAWTVDDNRYSEALEYVSALLQVTDPAHVTVIPGMKPPYFTLRFSTDNDRETAETTLNLLTLSTEDSLLGTLQDSIEVLRNSLKLQLSHKFALTMLFTSPSQTDGWRK